MINIPSYIEDPSYRYASAFPAFLTLLRYRMPKMVVKKESRLNGAKTNIFNITDVAQALQIHEDAIIKYMCAELGTSKEKKSIIKGTHSPEDLKKLLDKFIEKYILCQKCKYPETTMFVESKLLASRCRACGHINKLDNHHRVAGFLITHVPKDNKQNEVEAGKKDGGLDGEEEKKRENDSDGGDDEEKPRLELNSDEISK